MSIAKPLRYLAAVSVLLVFFLIYQYSRPIPTIAVPPAGSNGDKIENWDKDPLLEREHGLLPPASDSSLTRMQLLANLRNLCIDTPTTIILPTVPTRRASMPHSSPSCAMKSFTT